MVTWVSVHNLLPLKQALHSVQEKGFLGTLRKQVAAKCCTDK